MTPEKLIEIAKRNGDIRWNRSGLKETLSINKSGFVTAHTLNGPLSLRLTAEYACEEIVTNTVEIRS
jgi:hypothetical protein